QLPLVALEEGSGFAATPQYPRNLELGPWLLSDVDPNLSLTVGAAPRVVDPSLMALDAKQAGGVSHIANPHHVRGRPWGEASAACAALRNKRVDMKTVGPRDKAELAALKGQLAKQRAAAGGVVLPARFHRVQPKVQLGLKYEESDLSRLNRTRFAGLDNDLPNSFANALLQ
ncbi:PAB-dependent poly(A)-specific ribonuclease subunit 2, partial [Haematococcus lacustris]